MRTRPEVDRDIAATLAKLTALRAERKLAARADLTRKRADVKAAFERGDDRLDILRTFELTDGQLAGWAHRGGWYRPVHLAKRLSPVQRAVYHRLRPYHSKTAAVVAAGEVTS